MSGLFERICLIGLEVSVGGKRRHGFVGMWHVLCRVCTGIHVAGYKLYPTYIHLSLPTCILYQVVAHLLLDTKGYKSTVT